GAENTVIVGRTGERGKDLLAVEHIAARNPARDRAEGRLARGSGAAFGEGLRIKGAFLDDAPVMLCAMPLVPRALLRREIEVIGQRARPQGRADMHVEGQRRRAAITSEL